MMNVVIGGFSGEDLKCNCPITANFPIILSDYNFVDQLEQRTAVYAPVTFEKIVIVMINAILALIAFLQSMQIAQSKGKEHL